MSVPHSSSSLSLLESSRSSQTTHEDGSPPETTGRERKLQTQSTTWSTPVKRQRQPAVRALSITRQAQPDSDAPSPRAPTYPVAISKLMNDRLEARTASGSVQQKMVPVDAFYGYCSHTRSASSGNWMPAINQATRLCQQAKFPDQRGPSSHYRAFQAEINPLLDQELAILGQLPAYLEKLGKAGVDVSLLGGTLADLMELLRAPALPANDLAHCIQDGFDIGTLVIGHRCGLTPTRLAEALDATTHSQLKSAESIDLFRQLIDYRHTLPDMPVDHFLPLARQAFACDLPAEHLKPMLLAGVPITERMKPDGGLSTATVKTSAALGGGASGSPVKRVTLVMPDGTEKQVVTKALNLAPLSTPTGHMACGIPFPLDAMAEEAQRILGATVSGSPAFIEAQNKLTGFVNQALLRADKQVIWAHMKADLPPTSGLPNLYGRDLAMRELADAMGRPTLVAPVRLAVIDGVYCEVSDYNPDVGQQVVRHTGDALLPISTPQQQKAVARMTDAELQQLATSRGFASAQRLPYGTGIRFVLKDDDRGVGYLNRVNPDDPAIRRQYADHMVKNYLANEADAHLGNFSTGPSWDHDGSFGTKTDEIFSPAMPKVVSASVWAALQDGAWNAQVQRFQGLIQPAEIAAMQARRQALMLSGPQVVKDDEWDTAKVAQALGLTALDAAVSEFLKETSARHATRNDRTQAVKELTKAIDDLPADQLLAQHAGLWLQCSLMVGAGQVAQAAFIDEAGWTGAIEKIAAEHTDQSSVDRPAWAQNLGSHFDAVAERHAGGIDASNGTLKKIRTGLAAYGTTYLLADTGNEAAYRKSATTAIAALEKLQKQLGNASDKPADKLAAKAALQQAIKAEIASWNQMTALVADHQARFPDTLTGVTMGELLTLGRARLPQAELQAMDTFGRDALPAIRREGPALDDLQELITARTSFAPQLPLAHFLAMKMASVPVNAATVPDPALSRGAAEQTLTRLGSGNTATVWQADLGAKLGAWAFKPEPDAAEVPDAGIDTGIQRLGRGERLGPNFTGRTVAAAKAAEALGFDGAPQSKPVVFRDPSTGNLVYGAASRLVKGAMLQEAEGKPAVLTLDSTTRQELEQLTDTERQQLIDRVAQRMGFRSATWDGAASSITLDTTRTEFRRPLDWTDPDLRRSMADGSLWAALTAQADNHAGNYMQETTVDGVTRLVAIDNDVSAGARVQHPLQAAAEYNRDVWERYLKGGKYEPARPDHITGAVRQELLQLGVAGLTQKYPLPSEPEPTLKAQEAHHQKFKQLINDLQRAQKLKPVSTTSATNEWQRQVNAFGKAKTHAAGLPKVISTDTAQALLNLTEDQVRNDLFGGLGPAEQDAAWARTQVLQQMVRSKAIQTIKATEWHSERVRDLMGLNPTALKRIAKEDLDYAASDRRHIGTPSGDRHRLEYGLAAAFALEERMAREQADRIARQERDGTGHPVAYEGPALFDPDALRRRLQEEARKALERVTT